MKNCVFILLLTVALYSCDKTKPAGVFIRIESKTGFTMDSVRLVYDTTNYNFGTILSGQITGYISFKSLPNTPEAEIDSANKKILAGQLIPPNS